MSPGFVSGNCPLLVIVIGLGQHLEGGKAGDLGQWVDSVLWVEELTQSTPLLGSLNVNHKEGNV
jgi:hypothetical protein